MTTPKQNSIHGSVTLLLKRLEGGQTDVMQELFDVYFCRLTAGQYLATATSQQFQLRDIDHGRVFERPLSRRPDGRTQGVFALAFSLDGIHVAVGGNGFRLFDVVNTRFSDHEFKHTDNVLAIAFSPNGRRVVAGCRDGLVHLWDVESGTVIGEPWKHDAAVLGIRFSPDGSRVATSGHDGRVRQWDVETATVIGEPWIYPDVVHAVAFTADGRQVITGCFDGKVRIWDAVHPIDIDDAIIRGGQIVKNGRLRSLSVRERREPMRDSHDR